MARTIGIGKQDFSDIIQNHCFYVDKTHFIKEWWENQDNVTLITRPRRFGKTLNLSMLEQFFSIKNANRQDLFKDFFIWKDQTFRKLQGTYPVISLSFASVKENNYKSAKRKINELLTDLYEDNSFLYKENCLSKREMIYYDSISPDMDDTTSSLAIYRLAKYLTRYYGKKTIILLDEYDTPMQEAYMNDYWEQLTYFIRNLFQSTFKSNPYLERGLMTGITRISKESIFSDLNNLEVITTTSPKYETAFGFTESEVFAALNEFGYSEKETVKSWYDGFTFGKVKDIYNPWSIIKFLDSGELKPYWANTSSNRLIGELIRKSDTTIKQNFERLMINDTISVVVDEEITFHQLKYNPASIWSFLLASGYLKIISIDNSALKNNFLGKIKYNLAITNGEVQIMCTSMIREWFTAAGSNYNSFINALLADDIAQMNIYMNEICHKTFSFFDTGKNNEPECFYHGFVLGLIAELADQYYITSNRESGYGRYDVMLEPVAAHNAAIIIEFKSINQKDKKTSLPDAVQNALHQIHEKKYDAQLIAKGFCSNQIRHYGFAFKGKKVLIGNHTVN